MIEDDSGANSLLVKNCKRKAATTATQNLSKKQASCLKRVSSLLRKKNSLSLSEEEQNFLLENSELVTQFYKRREKRVESLKRLTELEDYPAVLEEKCLELAQAIHDSEFLIVYTGAGISTSASIPDYRGPNGIWTRLQKGQDIGKHDLTTAEPTLTHMAVSHLYNKGIVRHVVSQNCDGLHLRSGLPKTAVSEVHGNMYIEVCKRCRPAREYVRIFDVTENTSKFKHKTGRRCYRCGEPLVDTIVHFGERGKLRWPLNWQGACQSAKACDTILCLGSSLKVLRKYPWLWQMERPAKRRPNLYIVNLQWTPKDKDATIKINGKCDDVMKLVMKSLGFDIPKYIRKEDPIFQMYTPVHSDELCTFSQPVILEHDESSPDEHDCNETMSDDTNLGQVKLNQEKILELPIPVTCSLPNLDPCFQPKTETTKFQQQFMVEDVNNSNLVKNEVLLDDTKTSSSCIFTTSTISTITTTCTATSPTSINPVVSASIYSSPVIKTATDSSLKASIVNGNKISMCQIKSPTYLNLKNNFTGFFISESDVILQHKEEIELGSNSSSPLKYEPSSFTSLTNGLGYDHKIKIEDLDDSNIDLSKIKVHSQHVENEKSLKIEIKSEVNSIVKNGVLDGYLLISHEARDNKPFENFKEESKLKTIKPMSYPRDLKMRPSLEIACIKDKGLLSYKKVKLKTEDLDFMNQDCEYYSGGNNAYKETNLNCLFNTASSLIANECNVKAENRPINNLHMSDRKVVVLDLVSNIQPELDKSECQYLISDTHLLNGIVKLEAKHESQLLNGIVKLETKREPNCIPRIAVKSSQYISKDSTCELQSSKKNDENSDKTSKESYVKTKILNNIFSSKKRSPTKVLNNHSWVDICKSESNLDGGITKKSFSFDNLKDETPYFVHNETSMINDNQQGSVEEDAKKKEIDSHIFYGTGLCIRSLPAGGGSDNMEEDYLSIEEDTLTDNSLQFDLMETDAEEILEKINEKLVNKLPNDNDDSEQSSKYGTLKNNSNGGCYQLQKNNSQSDIFNYCKINSTPMAVVNGVSSKIIHTAECSISQSNSNKDFTLDDNLLKNSLNCINLSPIRTEAKSKCDISPKHGCDIPLAVLPSPQGCLNEDKQESFLLHTQVIDGVIQVTNFRKKALTADDKVKEIVDNSKLDNLEAEDLKEIWHKSFLDCSDQISSATTGMLDDEVKRLWFWGFDSSPKREELPDKKRMTRSALRKDSRSLAPRSKKKCCCRMANPQLCQRSQERSNSIIPEERMLKVRESIKRRRPTNYIKYEPVFEVRLSNNTYQKVKVRKPSKCWYEESDSCEEEKGVESPEEETNEIRTDEKKIVPGWYGKGYKKGFKKRRQYSRNNSTLSS